MTDELRMRAVTSSDIGIKNPEREAVTEAGRGGRVLIVEDRPLAHEHISALLAGEHSTDIEPDPNASLFQAAEGNYDVLIVSLGLKNFDGLRLCSQVRSLERTRNIPILAVSDTDDNTRLVRGLEIGVNDYLFRPIDKNELLARVRAVLRRVDENANKVYEDDLLLVDFANIRVVCKGAKIKLTHKEFTLLSVLAKSADRVQSRQQLLDSVWGHRYYGDARTLDVHIRRLRQKLGDCGNCIETVVGVGYRFTGCSDSVANKAE